jgi:hypothetical protein
MIQNVVTYCVADKKDLPKVEEWYMNNYPPLGYMTKVEKIVELEEGGAEITFSRLSSCD